MYRASNGITAAILTEAQARAHYGQAEHVRGKWGGRFTTYLIGTNARGQLLTMAETVYIPCTGDDTGREGGMGDD